MKYDKELTNQLRLYDKLVKRERKRIIEAYPRYGKAYKHANNFKEAFEEICDLFGYLMMEKMKNES